MLHALEWFFRGGSLDLEDVSGRDPEKDIKVEVAFTDLTPADRAAFGSYAIGDSLTLWRIRYANGDEKLTEKEFSPKTRSAAEVIVGGLSRNILLEFVGEMLVRRYGCFGCHLGISEELDRAL